MARKFVCSKTEPVVETTAGKLRGFQLDSTYIFQGVEYARAERFQAPQPIKPWEGVKDALSYGFVCPLLHQETPNGEIMVPHRYWPMDEHCQNLNIWTQTLDKNAKKPVMVWLHGGGFSAGSAIEHVAYDGENMSRFGDVVVVSVNHRLNILGYLDMEPYGEKYKNSANAGNADLVAALRWIHENIEGFGGDPENVTLFGQSGGGMKVYTLMQTPEADGLFQKGIIMSGVLGKGFVQEDKADSRPLISAMLAHLGLTEADAGKLETLPYAQLAEAYNAVKDGLQRQGLYTGCSPVPNDFYLGDPRTVGFTEHAKTIPVMVGSVFGEFAFGPAVPTVNDLSEAEKAALVEKKFGQHSEQLISLFRKAWPEKDLTCLLTEDSIFRIPSWEFIEAKARCPESPTYSYLFAYDFPYDGGKTAWHCSDIPFAFHNIDLVPVCNEPGVTDKLQDNVFGAYINFARNGDPGHSGLPNWPACKPQEENIMVLDTQCTLRKNFDHELTTLLEKAAPPWPFGGGEKDEESKIQH